MADGPALALQKALIVALKADAAVFALVGVRVYDEPPQAVVLPYIRLGHLEVRPVRTTCGAGWDVSFGIEAYSRPVAGRVVVTQICEAVVTALDQREAMVPVALFHLDWLNFQTQTAGRDGDGESYVGVVAFEASLSATS